VKRYRQFLATAVFGAMLLAFAALVGGTAASPPSGVTPTLLARGVYEDFEVKIEPPLAGRLPGQGEITGPRRRPKARLRDLDRLPGGTAIQARSSSRSRRGR
jgi:hypothetical protein